MPSISYHLTLLVLKLKGVKKGFSKAPVDVQQLRKEDVHQPSKKLLGGLPARPFRLQQTTVTEITPKAPASDFLLLYCPGGAYVYGPTELNWKSLAQLVKTTRTTAWLVDYPKAPEIKIGEIASNIDEVYTRALKSYSPSRIILLGDSVGGSLVISLVQRLIRAGKTPPATVIGITPVMDASMTNPEIEEIDKADPILSKKGVLSAKKMCAGRSSLTDPLISPLYGSFKGFPSTWLFIAENDILRPDQQLAVQKMREEGVTLVVVEGKNMPHIWPLLPVMQEAKEALSQVGEIIRLAVEAEQQPV